MMQVVSFRKHTGLATEKQEILDIDIRKGLKNYKNYFGEKLQLMNKVVLSKFTICKHIFIFLLQNIK